LKSIIDFYYLSDSKYYKQFDKYSDKTQFEINYISINEIKNQGKSKSRIIIFEEESFITSIDNFKKILSNYNAKSIAIILSNNTDVFNVVQWMREGASDYLIKNLLNKDILYNSITGALDYLKKNIKDASGNKNIENKLKNTPVIISKKVDWKELSDGRKYNLSLCLFEIGFQKESNSRYSKESMENIFSSFINEAGKIAQNFEGKLWYRNSSSGALLFPFDDYINCSVLSAMNIYNSIFSICYETLKLQELLNLKIIVHFGYGLYNSINTSQITSDLINSATHLIKLSTEENTFNITEEVYTKLNPRIMKYFSKSGIFEKRKIYKYNFFNY